MSELPDEARTPSGGVTERPAPGRPKARRRPAHIPRKPSAKRFAALILDLPDAFPAGSAIRERYLTAAIAAGVLIAAFWPEAKPGSKPKPAIYEMAAETPPPPKPKPPPPRDPTPPPPKPVHHREPPPPPQFGLQKEALAEKSDLTVAAGNTVMTKADPIAAKPAPPLPPQPEMIDHPLRVVSGPDPVYPPRARDRGLEATVVAIVTIDSLGRVVDVKVNKSGGGEFNQAVLKAVMATRFEAPIRNGHRVPSRFLYPVDFRSEG